MTPYSPRPGDGKTTLPGLHPRRVVPFRPVHAAALLGLIPGVVALLIRRTTGATGASGAEYGVAPFLAKPFTPAELADAVRKRLDAPARDAPTSVRRAVWSEGEEGS